MFFRVLTRSTRNEFLNSKHGRLEAGGEEA
jgi:hypothetical protein